MAEDRGPSQPPIKIKKYPNRRLYNTASSSYVTLETLSRMVKDGGDFRVIDAKNGEDITRSILTQIIVEEEAKTGQALLPIGFLRQLIKFYGDSLQPVLPRYLDQAMQSFTKNQDRLRTSMREGLDAFFPVAEFEELGRQNLAVFESAMKMFTGAERPGRAAEPPPAAASPADQVDELRRQLDTMRRRIDELSAPRRPSE